MSLERDKGSEHLVQFRRILPGVSVTALAEKIHELARKEVARRRREGEDPPFLPSAKSLRIAFLHASSPIVRSDLRGMLDPIVGQLKEDLFNDPACLNGKVPVDTLNANQLFEFLIAQNIKLRKLIGEHLVDRAAKNGNRAGFAHIPKKSFQEICTKLNECIKGLDLDRLNAPTDSH